MKSKLLFLILVFQVSFAQQRTCGSQELMQTIMNNPIQRAAYLEQQVKFETELQKVELNGFKNTNAVIRIPVAVHYPTTGSVSDIVKTCLRRLAQKQIDVLNADYTGTNSDIANWASVSENYPETSLGNLQFQFVIATQNHPAGTGLVEGSVAVTFGTDFIGSGSLSCNGCNDDTTWNGYMNIVVTNISGGILGFSPLGGSPGIGKTVVIDNNAFGSALSPAPATCAGFSPNAPYNKGRTLTHEIGHFFNLAHTFQACDGANCASSGDRVCDTPSTDEPRYDCNAADNPPDPNVGNNPPLSTCGNLQLTMNYMDYVEDSCMYMFTANQATRIQAWYNAIANQFSTTALTSEESLQNQFSLYPNPSKGSFTIEFKDFISNYSIEVFDITGKTIYENNFDQSANLIQVISLDNPANGVYFVNITSDKGLVTKKLVIQ